MIWFLFCFFFLNLGDRWKFSILSFKSKYASLTTMCICHRIQYTFMIFKIVFNCKHKETMMSSQPKTEANSYIYGAIYLTWNRQETEISRVFDSFTFVFFSKPVPSKIFFFLFSIQTVVLDSEWPTYDLLKKTNKTSSLICK